MAADGVLVPGPSEWLGTVGAADCWGAGLGVAGLIPIQEQRSRPGGDRRAAGQRPCAGWPASCPRTPRSQGDLEAEDLGVLPLPTIWPLAAALGFTMLFTGLIYGLWLVILGLGLLAYADLGLAGPRSTKRNRYGRLEAETTAA